MTPVKGVTSRSKTVQPIVILMDKVAVLLLVIPLAKAHARLVVFLPAMVVMVLVLDFMRQVKVVRMVV